VPDRRCIGLAVRVAPSGIKTWDLAYRIKGARQTRRLSLGRVSDVSLEAARRRANELTSAARNGRDLLAEEKQAREAAAARITVERLIALYVRRRVAGRLRTAKEIESRLRRALAGLLDRRADDLRRRDIREALDQVADQGLQREAEKRRQTVGAMFRWALSQDIVEADPTAGLGAYDPGTPRDRVLSADEITALWAWLASSDMPPEPADVLRLQLASGARCGEISGMCAEEIDRESWTWTLPESRSKNGKPRVTPLVGIAREIVEHRLQQTPRGPLFRAGNGRVFTSAHIGHYLLSRAHRLPIAKFTTHDLRRTVATTLAEMGISFELIAAVVGHESGGRETRTLVRHYVRSDLIERKRAVLDAWDGRLQATIDDCQSAENVIRLGQRAASLSEDVA
jgi:integrase